MKPIQTCPICGSEKIEKKHQSLDFLVTQSFFSIMECDNCGTCTTSPQPDTSEIDAYYKSEDYISHSGKSTGIIESLYKIARFFTLRSKRTLIENESMLRKGKLLDIGCGSGEFLQFCQDNGWDVTGIEPGDSAREKASELLGKKVLKTDALFQNLDEKFDVITMWHVLEHVHDPNKYISHICDLLNPKGVIIIAVPNYTSTDANDYGAEWAAWDVPRHLFHYSPKSMRYLVFKAGMKLDRLKMMPFDPFYVSLLTEKSVKSNGSIIKACWVGFKSWFISLFAKENASSLIYIIRKS